MPASVAGADPSTVHDIFVGVFTLISKLAPPPFLYAALSAAVHLCNFIETVERRKNEKFTCVYLCMSAKDAFRSRTACRKKC